MPHQLTSKSCCGHLRVVGVTRHGCVGLQDKINSLTLSGPHRLSTNDLLCSMLWHASCLVRDRTDSAGVFNLMFDLRQMHVPDAYFGNAHCVLNVTGGKVLAPCFNQLWPPSCAKHMCTSTPMQMLNCCGLH